MNPLSVIKNLNIFKKSSDNNRNLESITNFSSIVRDNSQAIILCENKSMIVERNMNPSLVQMYVISVNQTASGRLGLNFCFSFFSCINLKKNLYISWTIFILAPHSYI